MMIKKCLGLFVALTAMTTGAFAQAPRAPSFGGNQVDVTSIGMQYNNGFDNSTKVPALLAANGSSGGIGAWFPSKQTDNTVYYFSSSPFYWGRHGRIQCGGAGANGTVYLTFAPGVNGIIQENAPHGTGGQNSNATLVEGCSITSAGFGSANDTNGSNTVTGANFSSGVSSYGVPVPVWQAGDGFLAIPQANWNNQPNLTTTLMGVPPGTTVTAATGASGNQTLTLSGNVTDTLGVLSTYQLPAALMYSATTTTGSSTVTLTAGPTYKLQPGDFIWTDAFPFGAMVWGVSGTSYPITLTISDSSFDIGGTLAATATHTAGSGKLWLIPSGLSRKVNGKSRDNQFLYWPIGLNMGCSGGAMGTTCTNSTDSYNFGLFNIVFIYYAGADAGGSVIEGNIASNNYLADFVDMGSVGSVHLGNGSNCEESRSCPHGVIGYCSGNANTAYIGEYDAIFNAYSRFCVSQVVGGSAQQMDISIQTGLAGSGGYFPMVISPQINYPQDTNVIGRIIGRQSLGLAGQFLFSGGNIENGRPQGQFVANANSSGASSISVALLPCYVGTTYTIADATTPAAIPGGTTITSLTTCQNPGTIGTSAPVNVLNGDILYLTNTAPCIQMQGGYSDAYTFQLQEECGAATAHIWRVDMQRYAWQWVNPNIQMYSESPSSHDYTGDGHGYMFFPRGFKIASNDSNYVFSTERIFDGGTVPPTWTAGQGQKEGNLRINFGSGAGGAAFWYQDGTNPYPAGPIANDVNGYSYIIGTLVAIASLPSCSGTSGARATVNNGIASPTYHQAVSTTGSTVQPVICAGGTGWIYD